MFVVDMYSRSCWLLAIPQLLTRNVGWFSAALLHVLALLHMHDTVCMHDHRTNCCPFIPAGKLRSIVAQVCSVLFAPNIVCTYHKPFRMSHTQDSANEWEHHLKYDLITFQGRRALFSAPTGFPNVSYPIAKDLQQGACQRSPAP
jgi:hypothetical protein